MHTPTSGSSTSDTSVDWTDALALQLEWHWDNQVRPRLDGLTDAEYLWEPVRPSWSIRPRRPGVPGQVGTGPFVIDFADPIPEPPPVTTIAWRIGHLLVGVFGERNARYFGGPPVDYVSNIYLGTAAEALEQLDEYYGRWMAGVRGLDQAGLATRCREPGFESDSMAALILHIHREIIHHCAEVALLRDLYLHVEHSGAGLPRVG